MTTTNPLGGNVAALPKWAQRHIAALETELARCKRRAAEASGDQPSDVWVGDYITWNPQPVRTAAAFYVDGPVSAPEWNYRITCRLDNGAVEVMGSGPIAVEPRAANIVKVRLVDD